EKSMGTADKGETWDEDAEPPNVDVKGDTLSHYEEYRGFQTLNGGFRRLDPKLRQHFVIDPGKLVLPDLVKTATGIEVVITDKAHTQLRVVNFRRGHGHVKDK